MTTTANPYAAPAAEDIGNDAPTYQPKILSLSGRIGRARYLAYGMAWTLLMYLVAAIFGAVSAVVLVDSSAAIIVAGLAVYVLMLVPTTAMLVRRLNDLNHSGWLALLMLVPLVNIGFTLYILFAPGTKGPNRYGPAPAANSGGVIAAATILPLIFVIGILAAVAIPAYQEYVERAQAAQNQSLN
ncbi:DUF805 domain-containing protein [Proteobacteria bacterium 005FR1]|nr:DUF805 domain-containing protein [Proteobacteria bacterium 005FR1]